MTKCLVTGASGFIGPHVVEALLARGDDVTCFVRPTSSVERLQRPGVRLQQGDVTDPASVAAAVAGVEVVYHVAGLTRARHRADLFRVNETGAANVAEACARRQNPPVLIHISSQAAAGPSINGRPRELGDPIQPVSQYGLSKRAGEIAVSRFAHEVPVTIVRPSIVFGEGDPASLDLFRMVWQWRFQCVPGYGPRRFSMIHAADLAALLIRAAEHGSRIAPSETGIAGTQGFYFAGSGEHPTMGELSWLIAKACGRRFVLVLPTPNVLLWVVGAANEARCWLLRRPAVLGWDKVREATAGSWTCSIRAAESDLGFVPARPLLERVRQTAQWYRDQGWM